MRSGRGDEPVPDAFVVGVGMSAFGRFPDKGVVGHGVKAAIDALVDAGVEWREVGFLACGASSVGSVAGSRVAQQLGPNSAEITSVDNASASGSAAFRHAVLAVAEERVSIAMAVG